jgi:hypothetical protein
VTKVIKKPLKNCDYLYGFFLLQLYNNILHNSVEGDDIIKYGENRVIHKIRFPTNTYLIK